MKYYFRFSLFGLFIFLLYFITSDQYKYISFPDDVKESFEIIPMTIGDYGMHTRNISANTFGATDKYVYTQYYKNLKKDLLQLSIYHYIPITEHEKNNFLKEGEKIYLASNLIGRYVNDDDHEEIRWTKDNQIYVLRLHKHVNENTEINKDDLLLLFEEFWSNN